MSPVRRLAAGLTVAAVAILATAAPASAHDSLTHSTPGADERLATAPESITLTFSGELLVLGDTTQGAIVLIVDESGHDWAGDIAVNGSTVTAAVDPGMPDAGYQVRWQVVSEDGHPIAGVVPFTVGDGEPMVTETGTDGTASPTEAPDQHTQENDGALRVLLIGGAGAAIAVVAFALVLIIRRRRTTAPATPDDGDSAEEL